MTTVLEIGAAFLLTTTLLTAAMFLAAFHLGRLVTRNDEQREVEVARAPRALAQGVHRFTARRSRGSLPRSP